MFIIYPDLYAPSNMLGLHNMRLMFTAIFTLFLSLCSSVYANEKVDAQLKSYEEQVQIIKKNIFLDEFYETVEPDLKDNFAKYFTLDLRQAILNSADKELQRESYSKVLNHLLYTRDHDALNFLETLLYKRFSEDEINEDEAVKFHNITLIQADFERAKAFADDFLPSEYMRLSKNLLDVKRQANHAVIVSPSTKIDFHNHEYIDLSSYTGVIATVNPQCHFFHNFLSDLNNNEELKSVVIDNTKWVSSAWRAYGEPAFSEWNHQVSDISINIAVNKTEWPEINYWGSPTFYFFEVGELKQKIVGWPKGSADNKIPLFYDGFKRINIQIDK